MNPSLNPGSCNVWLRLACCLALAALLAACGGGGGPAPAPQAPIITLQPASLSVQAGSTATFSVGLQDATGASYQWLRDGAAVGGANQASHAVTATTLSMDGSKWSVRVSNPGGTVASAEAALTVVPPDGISLVVPQLGSALDLATDAQGNTIAVLRSGPSSIDPSSPAVVARKFAPNGSELPYGPGGHGLLLPGVAPNANAFAPRYSGAAFDASGGIYVANVTLRGGGINVLLAGGGSLSKVAPDGQVTVLADWPVGSAGAVAPASVTLGPDGSLYFVDCISGHLMKRTTAGMVSSIGDMQAGSGNFFGPYSKFAWIAVESADVAYVITNKAYLGSSQLRRVQSGAVSLLAGNATSAGADATGPAASFMGPSGLALGRDGALYVPDGTRLRKVTTAGVVTTVAGQAGSDVLTPGPLPGSLAALGAFTIGADGVVQVMSNASLVRIRLP